MTRPAEGPTATALAPVRPIVAIIGRPNVGKSTLFNRLTGTRRAITDDRPGVTRDRIHATAEWCGQRFTLVDTGGLVPGSPDEIESRIRRQAECALEQADLVLFVCDAVQGITGVDRDVADLLRRRGTPCLLVANKVDHPESNRCDLGEFYALGLGDPVSVSAANGRHSGDLLDLMMERCPALAPAEAVPGEEPPVVRVVLAGRPNVGKSTLINRLAGQEISIVHDAPGTTRDATDVTLESGGRRYVLVDTAGVRRRARVEDPVEYFSGLRASNSIARADVVIVLIDAVEGATVQDARIMGHALEQGRGLVLAVNKWDLMAGREESQEIEGFRAEVRRRFPFLGPYPILVLSALTGKRTAGCLAEAAAVADRARTRLATASLNKWVEEAMRRAAPSGGTRGVRILYLTQAGVSPPTFLAFCPRPDLVTEAYSRYVENALRRSFDLEGTPVRLLWRHSRPRRVRRGDARGES